MSLTVRPMTDEEYVAWSANSMDGYAHDRSKALQIPLDEAARQAREQFAEMLPEGLLTDSTWLLVVIDDIGDPVGTLWLGRHPQVASAAFVLDIEIEESKRGNGFGRAAMLLAEDVVRDAGYTELFLNVFGFNTTAKRLYDSLGYDVVATTMSKPLPAS